VSTKPLIFAAASVAHRAPQEWAQFISALTAYANDRRDECIRSPLDMLQVTQGRAQASAVLRDLLADCVNEANKIETKQNQKPHQPR
jgi:histidine ammonia-lyase